MQRAFNFEMDLMLNGSEDLSVEALGKTSEVLMNSTWVNPSFSGGFLPEKRNINKDGFSVKYAILFIALNFIVFLFIEIRNKAYIHPFQYSLVAFALLLFYVLLTSISEQIGFNYAFLVSSIAVTSLISWYAYSILKNIRSSVWVVLLQSGLYIFLFTILQLEDYALLVGSIGLFVILAIIMKASQQIKFDQ